MKRILTFILPLLALLDVQAQHSLLLEAGQNRTEFFFYDSNDQRDTSYDAAYSGSWALGYSYAFDMGVYITTKLGMRGAGASYVYDDFRYRWNLQYGEYRLGVGYRYPLKALALRLQTEGYLSYLLSAEQRLHNLDRDMIAAGTFVRRDYGVMVSPGLEYGLTDNLDLYADAAYMFGLANIEAEEGQTTHNRLLGLNLGVRIKL